MTEGNKEKYDQTHQNAQLKQALIAANQRTEQAITSAGKEIKQLKEELRSEKIWKWVGMGIGAAGFIVGVIGIFF